MLNMPRRSGAIPAEKGRDRPVNLINRKGKDIPEKAKKVIEDLQTYRTELEAQNEELRRAEEEIRKLNAGLEERVRERTRELEKANIELRNQIAERKRSEEALRESVERFRVAITGSPVTVYQHDRDLRFTWVYNPPSGFSAGDFLGKRIEDVYTPEDAARLINMKREVIARGVGTRGETWLTLNGELSFVDFSVEPLRDRSGQVCGVTCATVDITERRRAEEALQHRTSELLQLNETLEQRVRERTAELRNLSSELLVAQEKERRRISQDLHDRVWQSLEFIRFEMNQLFSEIEGEDPAALRQKSKEITSLIRDTVAEIRSLQGDLWPSILDDIGILGTISWYCREFEKNHPDIRIERRIDLTEGAVPGPIKILIYRVMQEAADNVAKHSQASRLSLSLVKNDPILEFTIEDNGIGFDPEETIAKRRPWGGLGLLSMKERTELSGGSFRVGSTRGKGTTVRISWPLAS
jgi:PAS domain S-box-containing protein